MSDVLQADVEAVLELAGSEPDPIIGEMADHGRERGFPIIGAAAGRTLRLLAELVDAERVFEFGSGFGYSGAWWAGALPAEGELVLTDYDEDNLAAAREFFDRGEWASSSSSSSLPTVRFEAGDALETVASYSGPFDAVLIDHDKSTYPEALELAREKLADGAVVVADNVLAGPTSPAAVRAALEGETPTDDRTGGIRDYLERVRDDSAFETTLLPIGSGLSVSRYRE